MILVQGKYGGSKITSIIKIGGLVNVLDPEKGECMDPVGGDAILGVGGPGGPPVGVSECQLSLDRGGDKT
jgi:hypothetical protein